MSERQMLAARSVRYVCVIDENFGQIFFVAKWMMPALFRYKRVPHFSKNTTVQYLHLSMTEIYRLIMCTVCHTQVINTSTRDVFIHSTRSLATSSSAATYRLTATHIQL